MGHYENFPRVVHGIARFTFSVPTRQLQKTILEVAYRLNHEVYSLKDFTRYSRLNCEVSFEFGVAEGMAFNYIDEKELERFRKQIEMRPLRILDIFSVTRYHIINPKGKRTPLKFDYNMLRFSFARKTMELLVSHERGNRRISIEDYINFLTNKINEKLKQTTQRTLVLKYLRTL